MSHHKSGFEKKLASTGKSLAYIHRRRNQPAARNGRGLFHGMAFRSAATPIRFLKNFQKGLALSGKSPAYRHRRNNQSPRGAIRGGLFCWAISPEILESDGGRTSRRLISRSSPRRRQRAAVRTILEHRPSKRCLNISRRARTRRHAAWPEVHVRTRPPPTEIGFAPEMIASAIMPQIYFQKRGSR